MGYYYIGGQSYCINGRHYGPGGEYEGHHSDNEESNEEEDDAEASETIDDDDK